MKLQFNINYQTYYGQDLLLNIVTGLNGGEHKYSAYRMHTADGYHWQVEINREVLPGIQLNYFYSIWRGDEEERREWETVVHHVVFNAESIASSIIGTTSPGMPTSTARP